METTTIQTETTKLTGKQKLVDAFCSMNIIPFEELLDEELIWLGDTNKYDLLAQLKAQFEALKAQGNTELIPILGRCVGCHRNECGYRYEGNKTQARITYIIKEVEEGKFDLSQCRLFHVDGEPIPEMGLPT